MRKWLREFGALLNRQRLFSSLAFIAAALQATAQADIPQINHIDGILSAAATVIALVAIPSRRKKFEEAE